MPTKDITVEEAKLRFEKKAVQLGLSTDLLGKRVKYQGSEYEIMGLGYRIRKNGLLVKNLQDGTFRRIPIEETKQAFTHTVATPVVAKP